MINSNVVVKPVLDSIDTEGSIIFLGSGFSSEAYNIYNEKFPTGNGLKTIFADKLHVNPNSYDLQTLADEIDSNGCGDLFDLLYNNFTASELSSNQIRLLSESWMRVYTTNYDNVIELAYNSIGENVPSYCYSEKKPRRIDSPSVIHLHGAIHKTDASSVSSQLVLNEASYVRQHFEKSEWYEEFVRDVRFSKHVFFIGYSLSDYHISALLLEDEAIKDKCFFITGSPDSIYDRKVSKYGTVLPIGLGGFVENYLSLERAPRIKNPYELRNLKYINPLKDKKAIVPPTPLEILNLVTLGTFNEMRCFTSLPSSSYVLSRQACAQDIASEFSKKRTVLIHSHLGNGKTIFLSILSHRLSQLGYKCFWCKEISSLLVKEAKAISNLDNCVILFDSYDIAVEAIDVIIQEAPNAKFVVAMRTGIQDIRLHEVQKRLPNPLERVNINKLADADKTDFTNLLDDAGLLSSDLRREISDCSDIREIVTRIYKNKRIQEKFKHELEPILKNSGSKNIIIATNLLKFIGLEFDAAFIKIVTGLDAYAELSKFKGTASEMFTFVNDELRSHSVILSEYLIGNFFDPKDIIDITYDIIVQAMKRKTQRRYQAVISKLMQSHTLKRLLIREKGDQDELLSGLFNRLSKDADVNREPLFWLQYSIHMLDAGNYPAAEMYIEAAYSRAQSNLSFKTYQIDTHALRLYLILERKLYSGGSISRFDKIIEKLNAVISMVGEESHRDFAFKVLCELEPFIKICNPALLASERLALVTCIDTLHNHLSSSSVNVDYQRSSSELLRNIKASRQILESVI